MPAHRIAEVSHVLIASEGQLHLVLFTVNPIVELCPVLSTVLALLDLEVIFISEHFRVRIDRVNESIEVVGEVEV